METRLSEYSIARFDRGAPRWVEGVWVLVSWLFFSTGLPGSRLRIALLRLFGASIGAGVVIKPRARVKYPWRLRVGDHSWIGESAWIDNLALVTIGSNACISQGAYLCTGNHRWDSPRFDLMCRPILVADGAWVGAFARVAPGTIVSRGTVLAMGAVASGLLQRDMVYAGNPAQPRGARTGFPR